MDDKTVRLSCNGLGAQVYLPRTVFEHSRAALDPGDQAEISVLEDGRIALAPVDEEISI